MPAETFSDRADWLVWQLADSAFPTGGFAHSLGLEAAWQHGFVPDGGALRAFVVQMLRQQVTTALPFVNTVHGTPERAGELDHWCEALLTNHVARRASQQQGQTLLATVVRAFAPATAQRYRQDVLREEAPGHLPVVFGLVMQELGLGLARTVQLFLFLQMRAALSAAVRLGVVGPIEAQQIQASLGTELSALAERGTTATLEDLAQTAPLLELLQGTQDRLYSRLFQS